MDKKGLRRFPAPSVAAFTPLWLMYHTWRQKRFEAVDEAHRRLGPVVRISPNHVSFIDPRAYKDIYGHGSPIVKDDFYAHIAAGNPSMAQTTSKLEHAQKRKNLAHVFSAKEITAMEPRVMKIALRLCQSLKIKSDGGRVGPADEYTVTDGIFDLRPWLNMFSYDAITAMFFSNCYGFLEKGNDICPARTASGEIKHVHAMDTFHSAAGHNVLFAQLPGAWCKLAQILVKYTHGKQSAENFYSMADHQVTERLRSPPAEPDLFSNLPTPPSEKRPNPMPLHEIVAECTTMMDAGNDTTQTSLTNLTYQLAPNPEKQSKLHDQLSGILAEKDQPVAHYAELQKVPYLRACLDESFRCKPPVGFGLPRRTVGEGSVIAGHHIPAQTVVSTPLYAVHKDERLFKDASSFVPERWLPDSDEYKTSEQERQNLKDFVLPFSLGGRACIGRNLAYMQLSIVIAAIVLRFEWELAVEGSRMEMVERLNCNPKNLFVRARARKGVSFGARYFG